MQKLVAKNKRDSSIIRLTIQKHPDDFRSSPGSPQQWQASWQPGRWKDWELMMEMMMMMTMTMMMMMTMTMLMMTEMKIQSYLLLVSFKTNTKNRALTMHEIKESIKYIKTFII